MKWIATIFIILLSINLVYAVSVEDLLIYYKMDDSGSFPDERSNYDGTRDGVTFRDGNGIIISDYEFDGTDDKVDVGTVSELANEDQFSISFWIKPLGFEDYGGIFEIYTDANNRLTIATGGAPASYGGQDDLLLVWYNGGSGIANTNNDILTVDSWTHIVIVYDGTATGDANRLKLWANNESETLVFTSTIPATLDGGDMKLGWDSAGNKLYQQLDEFGLWDEKLLTEDEKSELWNGSSGLSYDNFDGGSVNDTTPPVISKVNQSPENLTTLNAVVGGLKINATITDDVKVNLSTVKVVFNTTSIEQYRNGIYINQPTREVSYNDTTGDLFNWYLDENFYLSFTENIDHEEFWKNPVLNNTLSTSNQWVKIRFYNVSNSVALIFSEIQDTNTTSFAEYYYCSDQYSTGNPIGSDYCTQFYVQTSKDSIHYHRGNSWHRIAPLNINSSGFLNDVYVTNTSYILKRGSSTGETYFYINNDTSSTQTTNNNGNSWSNEAYTVNAHIHQIHTDEYIEYAVCAEDNSSNKACSGNFTDLIDHPILPPSPVSILVPEPYSDYNGSMVITYTPSVSLTGQTITTYKIEYKKNTSSTWTQLESNNYPNTEYNWDLTNVANGGYNIRITTTDDLGKKAVAVSEEFTVTNVESLNTQLLTDISGKLDITNDYLSEMTGGLTMIWIAMLYIGILAIGSYLLLNWNYELGLPIMFLAEAFHIYFWQYWRTGAYQYLSTFFFILMVMYPIMLWYARKNNNRAYNLKT